MLLRLTAFLLAACGFATHVLAIPAHVQSKEQTGGTGSSEVVTFNGAVTVGSRLIATCVTDTTTTITAVDDSVNGSYTAVANTANLAGGDQNKSLAIWSFAATGAGTPAVTFTLSHSDFERWCFILEYSNAANIIDSDTADLASAGAFTCTNSTATAANELLVGVIGTNVDPAGVVPNNGETERQEGNRNQVEDVLTAGSGSVAAQWDIGNTQAATCSQIILGSAAASSLLLRRRRE